LHVSSTAKNLTLGSALFEFLSCLKDLLCTGQTITYKVIILVYVNREREQCAKTLKIKYSIGFIILDYKSKDV
jgi:hypothetical protein